MGLLPFALVAFATFLAPGICDVHTSVKKVKLCDVLIFKDTKYKAATGSGEKFDFSKFDRGADTIDQCIERCLKFGHGCKAVNFKKPQCEFLRYGITEKENAPPYAGKDTAWNHAYIFCDAHKEDAARNLDEDVKKNLLSLIGHHQKTGTVCAFVTFAERMLQGKYNWMRWWVALSKKKIEASSIRGHLVQVEANLEKKDYFLIAAYSEHDTIIPPMDTVSWDVKHPPEFWEQQSSSFVDQIGLDFYDNIVIVNSNPSDYECPFNTPKFAFYKNEATGKRVSGDGAKEGNFFFYYKSLSLASNFACRAGSGELEKVGVRRFRHCSGDAFAQVVGSSLAQYAAGKKLIHPHVRTELTSTLFKHLTSAYPEFYWTVYVGEPAPLTLLNCDGSTNCVRIHMGDTGQYDVPIVAVWTPKCSLGGVQESAKLFFLWSQKIQDHAFSNVDNAVDALTQYLLDPLGYMSSHNLNEKPDDEKAVKEYKRASKVIFLNEVEEKGSWNMDVQVQKQNGAQCQLVLTTKDNKKHYIFVRVDFYANFDKPSWCAV